MSETSLTIEQQDKSETGDNSKIRARAGRFIALISLVAIALGSFNDSVDALEKIYDFSLSQFTDIPSQDKLDSIYIRASSTVLEQAFGAPVYIKRSTSGRLIKYYQDNRFLLSAIIEADAIVAYLVFPLHGFEPDTSKSAGGERLLVNPLSVQESVSDLRANHSRIVTYYIEENSGGEFGNLYTSVSGYTELEQTLQGDVRSHLINLVDNLMIGDNIWQSAITLRETLTPNFYGYSTLGLAELEDAILTKSEFSLIKP